MYFRRNSNQLTPWQQALIGHKAAIDAGTDRRVADRMLRDLLPGGGEYYAFREKVTDDSPAIYLADALRALSTRSPEAEEALQRLLNATNNLTTVPNPKRALKAFADRVPLGTPKQYYHATLALAARLAGEKVPVFSDGPDKGKAIVDETPGAKEILSNIFFTKKGNKNSLSLTLNGLKAIILMSDAIVDSSDPSIPYIFPEDTGGGGSSGESVGFEVPKRSRRQELLAALGRGSGASTSSSSGSRQTAETRRAPPSDTRRRVTPEDACSPEERAAQSIRRDQNGVPEVIEVELDGNGLPSRENARYLVGTAQQKLEAIEAGRRAGGRVYLFPCRSRDPEGTVMALLLEMATAPGAADNFEDLF